MDGDGRPDYLVGAMGFDYANGLLDDGNLHNHDHLLAGWSGALDSSGSQPALRSLPGFPRIMEDMQFFLNPALADIDGDGDLEAINGSAGHIVHAYDAYGQEPAGWPKDTGQWILGSPAVGDVDGDGYLDVWTGTRDGYLYGWRTPANAAEAGRAWVGFHNDPKNTGNCATALRTYAGPPPLEEEGCGCGLGSADRPLGWVGTALCALFALFGIRRRRTGS